MDRVRQLYETLIARVEAITLVLVVLGAGGLWAFIELADGVVDGDTHHFDEAILLGLRSSADPTDPIGPTWFEEMVRDVTALGGVGLLAGLTLATTGYLLITRRRRVAAFVLAAAGTGQVLSLVLKNSFDRPRPDLVPHGTVIHTASFPSGHSLMSAVVWLTLGILLARLHRRRATKLYLVGLAVVVSLLVGFSRVYLAVHWPTDVLAGWALGATWAVGCWLLARRLERRWSVPA